MGRTMVRIAAIAACAAGFGVLLAPTALAYIDPGSGSYIIQIIAATFLALSVAVATFWRRIRGFFGRVFSRKEG